MPKTLLRGITWQHRRAIEPLVTSAQAFRRERPDIHIDWRSRPLASFEFQPVEELAAAYDLIVLDHPHAGDIARTACLVPVDEIAAAQPAALRAAWTAFRISLRLPSPISPITLPFGEMTVSE